MLQTNPTPGDNPLRNGFRLNSHWLVLPLEGRIQGPGGALHVQPKEMAVLNSLALRAGEVVTRDTLLEEVWPGANVGPEVLTHRISELRTHLGDDSANPTFIQTVPKIGYRLVATVDVEGAQDFARRSGEQASTVQPSSKKSLFADLKKRKVFRVAAVYCVVAWLVAQIAGTLTEILKLPDWSAQIIVFLLFLGFPVALVLAYALDVAPDGSIHVADNPAADNNVGKGAFVLIVGAICVIISVLTINWLKYRTSVDSVLPQVAEHSIAVLPFENLSEASEDGYIGAGLTEDIRLQLTRLTTLIVAPRIYTLSVVADNSTPREIAQRLGVAKLLGGTVRKDGDMMRVTVSLIDVYKDKEIWSKTYDSSGSSTLVPQNQISRAIALSLAGLLDPIPPGTTAPVPAPSSDSFEAYAAYLQGLDWLGKPSSVESLLAADAAFRRALAFDEKFAGAHAGLCETILRSYVLTQRATLIASAQASCERALELDSDLATVHLALAQFDYHRGEYVLAEESLKKALELDPRLPQAHARLGDVYVKMGARDKAESEYAKVLELQPDWRAYSDLGRFMLQGGRFDDAATYYQRSAQLNPDNENIYNNLGAAHFYRGDFAAAANAYKQSLRLQPSSAAYSNLGTMQYYDNQIGLAAENFRQATVLTPEDYRTWGNLGDALRLLPPPQPAQALEAYARAVELAQARVQINPADFQAQAYLGWFKTNLGDKAAADDYLSRALAIAHGDPETHYVSALIHNYYGDNEATLADLRRARQAGYPVSILAATPDFAPLRKLPGFREIISGT